MCEIKPKTLHHVQAKFECFPFLRFYLEKGLFLLNSWGCCGRNFHDGAAWGINDCV